MATVPSFVIIGSAGDGKSSVIKQLIREDQQHIPEVARRAGCVTQDIVEYQISGLDNADWTLIDTMGVGDLDQGTWELVAGLKHLLQSRQIDGVIVTTMIAQGRLGLATQILKEIITHGLVKDKNGTPPWGRVIVLGTQRDRCDKEEIDDFPGIAQKFFKETGHTPLDYQVATSSAKQTCGMSDLLASMSKLDGQRITWNPNFNAGAFARGVCDHTGGDPRLTQLELEMELKWQDGVANQIATGMGSGFMAGCPAAIKEGSEAAVGKVLLQAAIKSGQAVVRSIGGDVVMSVSTKAVVSEGAAAGAGLVSGTVGLAAELVAGQFEATKEYKRPIGFVAHVCTATTGGGVAGGLEGAVVGAGVGSVSWAAGWFLTCALSWLVR